MNYQLCIIPRFWKDISQTWDWNDKTGRGHNHLDSSIHQTEFDKDINVPLTIPTSTRTSNVENLHYY